MILCAALALLLQSAAPPALHPEAARAWLEERRAEQGFPGAQFAWAGQGEGRSGAVAAGVRERGAEAPLLAEDRMLWGSVGKTFVAAVALQLVQEGKFGLDDRVARHLGDRAWYAGLPNADSITLRHLLTHTSGIPDHVRKIEVWEAVKADPDRAWKTEELLAFALGDEPLCAAGERFEYADTNYVLLGAVIEKIGGAPLFDQVRARLLTPLQLAGAAPSDRRVLPGLVQGHPVMLAKEWQLPPRTLAEGRFFMNPQFEHGGGGMYGTPAALARWTWLLQDGDVLTAAMRTERMRGVPAPFSPGETYGLGVQSWSSELGPAAGHGGWYPGYRTETAWFAELGLAACVTVNTDAPREVRNLRALLTGCLRRLRDGDPSASPQFRVTPAPEWDALFDRSSGWTGADGIYSIPLDGDDRAGGLARTDTLFLFSDTFVGEVLANGTRRNTVMINNSVALLPRGGFPAGLRFEYPAPGGQPASVFLPQTPLAQPDEWYWPHDGVALQGTLHLFAQRFRRQGSGVFGFQRTGLAMIEIPPGEQPPFAGAVQRDCPYYLPATAQRADLIFGVGIMAHTAAAGAPFPDGYLYLYGLREDPLDKKLLCARVPPAALLDFGAWRFWDGAAWNADPERSAVLTGRVSSELSMTPLPDGRFLLVFMQDTLSGRIVAQVAQSPVGPFGPVIELYQCPLPASPQVFSYNAKAHPHLSGPGELLISYNVNGSEFWDHFAYADVYRPRFIRVSW